MYIHIGKLDDIDHSKCDMHSHLSFFFFFLFACFHDSGLFSQNSLDKRKTNTQGCSQWGGRGADCPPGHQKSGRRAKIGKGKKGERKEKRGKGREKRKGKEEEREKEREKEKGRKREKGKERKREEKKGEKGRKGGEEKGEEREENRKKMLNA